jgi:Asp-tRNA(Asn)/Glu-tRNA(Gln) amidotransferase A subunit family amidase
LWPRVEPDAAKAIEAFVDERDLIQLELPGYAELAAAQTTIQLYETARSLGPEMREHWEQLSAPLQMALEQGEAISVREYEAALGAIGAFAPELLEQLDSCDAVLTPSATGVPPKGLAFTGDPLFCRVWTLLGAPTLSVPVAWTPERLPAPLQLAAAPGRDDDLFNAANSIW